MKALDRAFFAKVVPISAARVTNNKNISRFRTELERSRDVLRLERLQNVRPDPELADEGKKCLLLQPEIKHNDSSTWSDRLRELASAAEVRVIPYVLKLDYEYWTYHDIMTSILPEEDQDELPTGFSIVGHIAHLNLRDQYLPYKGLIARVLLDKNPSVTTVINKTDDVGTNSAYRTFGYEVLAGEANMNVQVKELGCTFRFDYSKVYWNSRLDTEHRRLVDKFQPGEAVCDAMAGVGPFAVPAGKKGVFVWANDLNPASHESLVDAIARNHVSTFVKPHNLDAKAFIPHAIADLLATHADSPSITLPRKRSHPSQHLLTVPLPATFSHFIMNLPASATSFLPSFIGAYSSHRHLYPESILPLIHVYTFSTKTDDNALAHSLILAELNAQLGANLKEGEVEIWDVRDVAPLKRMFCATFRLPADVAFLE
ncbi:MAG: tRNA(m(1)G37)methyltransferase [Thelocarpon impressellum]|nr:MAG: tRNA(m(1)G37)methyltransferase [Thelocarpon impressellum]